MQEQNVYRVAGLFKIFLKTYAYLQAFKLNTVGIKNKYTTRKV